MKYIYATFLFGSLLFLSGCSQKKESPLEEVLKLAGSNRYQLEQVIKHYSKSPADSLKLKAAEFLIINMPGKYSVYYEASWEDVATVNLRWSSSSNKFMVLDTYKLGEPIRKDDINYITADFLISNIDLSFQVWQDKPWGKHISFETFCEEILPYRIAREPLENWREKVLASFADMNNLLKEDSTITTVEACCMVNDILPRFRLDKDFSNMSYTQLMATTRGMCDSYTALAAFVMRGLGIPVTIDYIPKWKDQPVGHHWNSVCDSTGQHISFMGTEANPYKPHQGNTRLKGKVYRKTFGHNRIINEEDEKLPPLFRENLIDVSSEHENTGDAVIPVRRDSATPSDPIFLALLSDKEWNLTGHGELDKDNLRFQHIGKEIFYLPVYYADGALTPAGSPFYIDRRGNTHVLVNNRSDSLVSFQSITTEDDLFLIERMVNGVFEISTTPDFAETRMIHKITKTPERYNKVKLKNPVSCRYIRYKAPQYAYGNVSEIAFYDPSGNKLNGTNLVSPETESTPGNTGDKAFDGNITTFFDAKVMELESWTGLDFGENKEIASIHYSPRFLGVGFYEGYEYELFQWIDNRWKSIAKKVATGPTMEFNVPLNTLLYIRNNTTKKEGYPFFISNGTIFY